MNDKLRQARIKHHKTQNEIALYAKISLKSYQRIEHEEQVPSVRIAILIAKALNSSVEELF